MYPCISPEKRIATAGLSQPSKRGLADAAVDFSADAAAELAPVWPAVWPCDSGDTAPPSDGDLPVQATYPRAPQIAMTTAKARIVRFDIRCSSFPLTWALNCRQKNRQADFRRPRQIGVQADLSGIFSAMTDARGAGRVFQCQ